jgi:hypothetical protein
MQSLHDLPTMQGLLVGAGCKLPRRTSLTNDMVEIKKDCKIVEYAHKSTALVRLI